jgi:uncharacterized protein YdeI (YjbR/CyaY-like superfamily)
MKLLYVNTKNEWRRWLQKNHCNVNELWLIFYKKETGKPTLNYGDAVEEALCFGWIDSIVKKINEEKYVRKFTPRKKGSVWSELNKKRVKKLIKDGRMTEFGLEKINAAKKSGEWNKKTEPPKVSFDVPKDFMSALNKNRKAKSNFEKFSPSDKKRYYMWINIAKKKETKDRRIKESIELLCKNKELGLK